MVSCIGSSIAVPSPRALALEQRREDRAGGDLSHDVIREQERDERGFAAALRVEPGDARDALHDAVIGRASAIGAAGAEAADRAVDEARPARARARRVEAEPRQRLGTHVGNQHVAAIEQPQHRVARARLLEIEADRALGAVEMQVFPRELSGGRRTAERAEQVAFRWFELDHLRAEIGEAQRAGGADDDAREIEHADAGERARLHSARASSAMRPLLVHREQRPAIAIPARAEPRRPAAEERPQIARAGGDGIAPSHAPEQLEQKQRRQSAIHDKRRIILDARRIGLIVVNAMRVEGHRGVAEQQRLVGMECLLLLDTRERFGGLCPRRRGGGGLAIDHVLILDDGRRVAPADMDTMLDGDQHEAARTSLLRFDARDLADAVHRCPDRHRRVEARAPPPEHAARQGERGQEIAENGMAIRTEPRLRRDRREQDHVPSRRQRVALPQPCRIAIEQRGQALHERQGAEIVGTLAAADPGSGFLHRANPRIFAPGSEVRQTSREGSP